MPKLTVTIDQLVASFTDDVMRALRGAALEDFARLADDSSPARRTSGASFARRATSNLQPSDAAAASDAAPGDASASTDALHAATTSARASRSASRAQNGLEAEPSAAFSVARKTRSPRTPDRDHEDAPAPLSAGTIEAAIELFTERGRKGATAVQLESLLGSALPVGGSERLVAALLELGKIRDAGFRRTTGKGTAPVYELAPAQ